MATINVPADFPSIQAAIDAASAGDTILVGPGTYAENVVIDKALSLLSSGGRDATTIQGDGAGGELGAIQVLPGVDNVTIGGPGAGFTVVGIDGNGAVEKAAIYLQGNHDAVLIQGNEVVANGDAGLLSEFGAAVTNATIDGNVFSGQTFAGAQPDGNGFATQFNAGNNVPRQLVTMGNGGGGPYVSSNIVFTNNDVSGTAGGITSDDGVSEQGNTLVTIDAANSTISGNDFTGFTNRFATAVRARGPNTEVSDNGFDASASGSENTLFLFIDDKGVPATYGGNRFIATDGTETFPAELTPGGDDTFFPGGGDDDIQGGGGFDTAVFAGAIADYAIVDMGGGVVVVTDLRPGSPEGTNTLRQFERFEFADGMVLASGPAIDLDLNDSSGATGNDFQGTFVEGGGPLLLNNGDIRITDPDDTTVQGAVVKLTNPLDGASETLAINAGLATVLGITATVAGDGHTIMLAGAASHAAYQAVLGTVTYENASPAPDGTDRRVTFQVSDGLSDSPAANATVAIMAINQAPTLDLDMDDSTAGGTGAASVFETGGAPVSVTDGDVAIGDADGTTLASATVTLANPVDGAAETLGIDLVLAGNLGLSVVFGPDNQSISITGDADHVFYELVLGTVTYDNGAPLPTLGDRAIEIVVNDGMVDSAVATGTVSVVGNPLPVDDMVTVAEDSVDNDLTAVLLGNDGDADLDSLTIAGASGAANGAVDVAPDGTLTYTPNADFDGVDAFVYTVSDGNGGLATATATVTVTGANDAPVLSDPGGVQFGFGFESGALVDDGGFGWFDAGGGPVVVPSGTAGVPSGEGSFHMTVGAGAPGDQGGAFTRWGGYESTFPPGGYSTQVAIYLDVEAHAGNDVGFAYANALNGPGGDYRTEFIFNVGTSANPGDGFVVGASQRANDGVAGVPAEPGADFGPTVNVTTSGWYSFRFTASESGPGIRLDFTLLDAGGNVVGTWTRDRPDLVRGVDIGGNRYGWVLANEIPDLPVDGATRFGDASPPPVFVEDQPVGVIVNDDFVITDVDDSEMEGATVAIANFVPGEDVLQFVDILGISGSFDGGTGVLTLSGSASVADYEAALSSVRYYNSNHGDPDTTPRQVDFTVNDGEADSAPVTVAVVVQAAADDPLAIDDNVSVAEDSGASDLTAAILANDNDPDGDGLTVAGADGATHGTLDVAPDGTVTYDPDGGFTGTDSFTYTITDGNGGATATATATVTVTGVNDPPVLNGGPVFGADFDDGTLNDGTTGLFDFGVGTTVVPSGTDGVASLSGGFHATVGTSTPGDQGGAFTRWGGYESAFPAGGYTTEMSIYLDVAAHAGNDIGFAYSNGLNRPDGSYRTEFYFNVGTTGDPADGFVIGASQRGNDGMAGVPAEPGADFGPTANVTESGWYTFQFAAIESGPGIRLDFTVLDASGTVVGTWSKDRPDLVRGVDIGGNRYGWVLANEIPDLPIDNIFKGEAAATPSVTFVEDGPPVVVDDAITVDDVDDVNLESATVAFVDGYVPGEDVLTFAGLGNISGTFDPGTGVLTLTGTDSLANYQAALRAVTYGNLAGDDPTAGVRTVRFLANDGDDDSNAVLAEIDVVPVNDAPVLDLDGDNSSGAADPDYQTAASAVGGPVLLSDGDIVLADADNSSLDNATIALTATPDGANDVLTVDAGLAAGYGITVIGNGTGAIMLTGAASVEAYRQVFASAAYENQAGGAGTPGVREVVFTANDGADTTSASAFVTVAVPPLLDLDFDDSTATGVDSAASFVEGGGAVVLNDGDIRVTDADGGVLQGATVVLTNPLDGMAEGLTVNMALATGFGISAVVAGDGHSIVLTGAASNAAYQAVLGTVRYENTSLAPDTTARTIDFTVNNGALDSNVATATVSVEAVNDAPVVDLDADDSTAAGIDAVATFVAHHGPVGILGPDVDIMDMDGTVISSAGITLVNPLDGAAETLSIDTVLAGNLGLTVFFGADNQSITLRGAANHLTYEVVLATVRYDNGAADPTLGERTVEVTVDDGFDESAVAVSTISVLPDPSAADDMVTVSEDSGANDLTAAVLGNDADADGDTLTVTGASGAVNGTVEVAPDGTLSYTPGKDYSGSDSFTYTVTDGNGGSSSATVTLTVEPVADDPTTSKDVAIVAEDSAATDVTAALLAGDSDADGDPLTVIGVSGVGNGTVDLAPDGTVTYTPDADFFGLDGFAYTITDGNGGATATASLTVTVTPVADDPEAADDVVGVAEDGGASDLTAALLTNDDDADGDSLTVVAAAGASNGAVAVSASGVVTYDPAGGFNGTDAFTYTITDGNGGATSSATVTVTVTGVNDDPISGDDTILVEEDSGATDVTAILLANDVDADGDSLTVVGASGAANGTVEVAPGGMVTFTPAGDFSGTDGFTYTVTDGNGGATASATVSVTVTSVADDPTATDDTVAVAEDSGATDLTAHLLANDGDEDGDGLTVVAASGSAHGTVEVAADGMVTFTPDGDFHGTDAFTYTITDGNGGATASATATIAVSPENDAPVLDLDFNDSTAAGGDFATIFTEGGPAALLNDGDIRITDIDGGTVQSAAVVLTNPLDGAQESLAINAVLAASFGISVAMAADGHSIALTGGASMAQYQAVLGTVTYANASIDPDPTGRTVAFTVNDGTSDSNVAVATVAIDPVNQAPTLDLDGDNSTGAADPGSLAYFVEDGPAVVLTDGDIAIADVDGPGIVGATVSILDAVDAGEVLSVDMILAGNLGVTVVPTGGGTGLEFQAIGPIGNLEWQQLLQTVAYDNATSDPTGDARSIAFTVTDGESDSNVAVAQVAFIGVNDDPAAAGDTIVLAEDAGAVDVTAALLANDTDVDGDALTVVGVSGANSGMVTLALDGTVSFTPDGDFHGTDSFTYTITDGNGGATSSASVAVTVTPVADDPVVADDGVTVAEDSGAVDVTAALLANDFDADGDPLTVVGSSGAANGTVDVAVDGTVTFTPASDFTGSDVFAYTITDGNGGATASATVTVTVTGLNDDPVATGDMATVAEDSGAMDLTAALLGNDQDPDGDALTVVGVSVVANGTVDVGPGGLVTFSPDPDFNGTTGFTYTITDGNGGATASATATITVTPTADDPVAADDVATVAEDAGATDLTALLLANDTDADGDGLTVVGASGAANGTVDVAPDGNVTFTPDADFFGTDAFTYTVTDGNGGGTVSATATITVTPTADDPSAAGDTVAVGEDSVDNDLTASLLANDGDVDGDALTIVEASGAANGTVQVGPDGVVTFTPDGGYTGSDSFTYTVTDGNGGATTSATVTVNVTDVNEDPMAIDDVVSVPEDSVAADLTAAILTNDADADVADVLTVVAVGDSLHGAIAVAPDGTVTYTPVGDYNGTDSFTYTITDGNGGATASAVATVTVTPVADDPVAMGDTVSVGEDSAANDLTATVLANDGDADGDALTVAGAEGAANGTVSVDPDGTLLYTPDSGFVGTDAFTYTVTDGNGGATASATVTVSVGPVNDDPTAADDAVVVSEDSGATDLTTLLLANDADVDGDVLTIVGAADGANGTVSVGPGGELTFEPDGDFSGTDAFTYTITDGNGGATASATATVSVSPVADDPVATVDGPIGVTENVPSTMNVALLANDFDADGDTLTIIAASGAPHGTLEFGPGGDLVYTPDDDYVGTDSFTYTITDGNGGAIASALATINVMTGPELAIEWELFGSTIIKEGQVAQYTVQFSGEPIPTGEQVSIEIGLDLPGGANGADVPDIDQAQSIYDAIRAAIDALGPDSGISLVANRLVFEAGAPTSLTFGLPIAADETTEGLEVFTVTIDHPSAGAIAEYQDLQATTILDSSQGPPEIFALAPDGPGAAAATLAGTDGNDMLTATAAPDVVDAGGGNDTVLAVATGDIVRAGGGDDHISVDGLDFRAIAGGPGTDTLILTGEAVELDLSADPPGSITGIEVLDIGGAGDNALDLTYADLLEVADPLGTLTVLGDGGDRVSADLTGANFVDEGIQDGFHVYSNGLERLLVSEEITDQSVAL